MVESASNRTPMSPEERAAKLAEQEAKIAVVYEKLGNKKLADAGENQEGKLAQALKRLASQKEPPRNPNALYFNLTAEFERARQEIRDEDLTYETNIVQELYTEEGELIHTVPDINEYVPQSFVTIFYEHRKPDTITQQGEYLAVQRTGFHHRAQVQKENDSFRVELLDMEEGSLTRKRLSGVLYPGTGEAVGRMAFRDDPDVFIHPSVAQQKSTSLRELFTLIEEEQILDVSYPQE